MDLHPKQAADVFSLDLEDAAAFAVKRGRPYFLRLSPSALKVWRLCDGQRSLREISRELARQTGLPDDPAWALIALRRLYRFRLVETAPPDTPLPNRNEARRRLTKLGLAATLLPVITVVCAPTPAQAGSLRGSGASCTDGAQCSSTVCFGGKCT
jgi:hypothetical protein